MLSRCDLCWLGGPENGDSVTVSDEHCSCDDHFGRFWQWLCVAIAGHLWSAHGHMARLQFKVFLACPTRQPLSWVQPCEKTHSLWICKLLVNYFCLCVSFGLKVSNQPALDLL